MSKEITTAKITAYHEHEPYEGTIEYGESLGIYNATLTIGDQQASGTGVTLHDAITQIRLIVEPSGWLLGVNSSHRYAGNVINKNGNYDDSVTIINNLIVKTLPALAAAELQNITNVSTQKQAFAEAQQKLEKSEQYRKDYVDKKIDKKNNSGKDLNRVPQKIEPKHGSFFALVFTIATFITPLSVYGIIPILTQTYGDTVQTSYLMTAALVANFVFYAINISAAYEYVSTNGKKGTLLFLSITIPVIAALLTFYFYSSETAEYITTLIPQNT